MALIIHSVILDDACLAVAAGSQTYWRFLLPWKVLSLPNAISQQRLAHISEYLAEIDRKTRTQRTINDSVVIR